MPAVNVSWQLLFAFDFHYLSVVPVLTDGPSRPGPLQEQTSTFIAKDEVQDVQVLAAKDVAVTSIVVGVTVHDCSCSTREYDNVEPGRQGVRREHTPLD